MRATYLSCSSVKFSGDWPSCVLQCTLDQTSLQCNQEYCQCSAAVWVISLKSFSSVHCIMVQFNPLHCNARSQCSEMYRQCTEHSQCSSEPPCVYRSLKSSNSVHWQNNAVQPRALPVHCTHTVQLRATLGQTWPQQMSSHSTVGLQSALNFNLQILSALECFRFQNTNKHFNNILTTKSCLTVCL